MLIYRQHLCQHGEVSILYGFAKADNCHPPLRSDGKLQLTNMQARNIKS